MGYKRLPKDDYIKEKIAKGDFSPGQTLPRTPRTSPSYDRPFYWKSRKVITFLRNKKEDKTGDQPLPDFKPKDWRVLLMVYDALCELASANYGKIWRGDTSKIKVANITKSVMTMTGYTKPIVSWGLQVLRALAVIDYPKGLVYRPGTGSWFTLYKFVTLKYHRYQLRNFHPELVAKRPSNIKNLDKETLKKFSQNKKKEKTAPVSSPFRGDPLLDSINEEDEKFVAEVALANKIAARARAVTAREEILGGLRKRKRRTKLV